MIDRKIIYEVLNHERAYQDQKWGSIENRPHEVGSWLVIMDVLLQEAKNYYAHESNDVEVLDKLRKVVAVGIACFEQHGIYKRD